jgi:hypothetical protein
MEPFLIPTFLAVLFFSAAIFSSELIWPRGISTAEEYMRSEAYRKEMDDIMREVEDQEQLREAAARGRKSKATLVELARHYILTQRPEWKEKLAREARVTETATQFEVTWSLPADTIGGVPVVIIDKRTGRVVKAYHTQ